MRILSIILLLLILADPAFAQTHPGTDSAPEEIIFVFGSDTSTPGIRVDQFSALYPRSGFDMYADPARQGQRVMDPAFRERFLDSYGNPITMTWWMQGGSLYRPALNTNVPLPSTMSTYLMYHHHRDAIEELGDEMSFHFHTWAWSDDNGDGTYMWNQTRTFDDSRDDFDLSLAEHLIQEDLFPVSYRSGWHYMDNLWQARLDSLLPFSMHNDWPSVRNDFIEPIDNIYDWSRSPRDFVPYQPAADDYQRPGGSAGWNTGSRHLHGVHDQLVRDIFEAARNGDRQVVCLWSHLAETDFIEQIEAAAETIERIAAEYPDVPFRYTTGIEAMQRWLGTTDRTAPNVEVEEVNRGGQIALRITTDEPLFQPVPFAALLDRYERYLVLEVHETGNLVWETEAFDRDDAAHVAVAATDSSGNLTTRHVRYLPDDIVIDNEDAGFAEVSGAWATVSGAANAQVWGADYRRATLTGSEPAVARWMPEIEDDALYNVFVRIPDDNLDAAAFDARVIVNGNLVAETSFDESPPPAEWAYAGTVELSRGGDAVIELAAAGQAGRVLAADAVKLTARIAERRLVIEQPVIPLGEIVVNDTTGASLRVLNSGIADLTIVDITSRVIGAGSHPVQDDIFAVEADLPLTIGPMQRIDIPIHIRPFAQGTLTSLVQIESDDPVEPQRSIRIEAHVLNFFETIDDMDPVGYEEHGTWATSSALSFRMRSRFATPSADASAVFSGKVGPGGTYAWAYIVPFTSNAAIRAQYELWSDGVLIDDLIVNQNTRSNTWRMLGLVDMPAGAPFEIDVSWADVDQPGRVLRADAVRLYHVGKSLAEVVLDNDDEPTADGPVYREEGSWSESVATSYGPTSRWAPANGSSRAFYRMTATRSGIHGLYQMVPTSDNGARNAVYVVSRNASPVDSVFVDQSKADGDWQFLTAAWFAEGDEINVEVTHTGPPEPEMALRADALRLVFSDDAPTRTERALPGEGFVLGPNFPNPASGSTSFSYELGQPADVRIVLYDALGRQVTRLIDEHRSVGVHSLRFDASTLSSGVYFCRMEVDGASQTQVWVVVR